MSPAATVPVDDDLWSAIGDPTRRRMLDVLLIDGDGTLLKFTETGFRDQETRLDHVHGWDHFLPRIAPYVAGLRVRP